MIIAGLTGGIASGKSTVSNYFKDLGAVLIDADQIARKVVEKGMPAWQEISLRFGQEILLANGEIDRQELGRRIFYNPQEKQTLNRIVHPHVFEEMENEVRRLRRLRPDAVVIQDVPLLIESGMHGRVDEVILVYVPEAIQVQRLMKRDAVSEADARARISSQMDIEEKRRMAGFIIDNQGSREETEKQTRMVYGILKQKADSRYDSKNS